MRRGALASVRFLVSAGFLFLSNELIASEFPRYELFSGSEFQGNAAIGYVGGGWGFGKPLHEPGPRLRAAGAFGRYDYDGCLHDAPITFDGRVGFGEALLGYQFRHA